MIGFRPAAGRLAARRCPSTRACSAWRSGRLRAGVGEQVVVRPERRRAPVPARRRSRWPRRAAMPVTRRRSASATSRMLRASMSCTCCARSPGLRRSARRSARAGRPSRMFFTSRRCASTSASASSTTRTDSMAVTSAQNARVASRRTSALAVATSLLGRRRLRSRRALQRLEPAERVDGPLQVEARAPVVGDVRVDDARRRCAGGMPNRTTWFVRV